MSRRLLPHAWQLDAIALGLAALGGLLLRLAPRIAALPEAIDPARIPFEEDPS